MEEHALLGRDILKRFKVENEGRWKNSDFIFECS
jgi:hypothetical protein